MNNHKTLIFIGAHPDDETFGMGATLAQYADQGVKVYYVCATRGEAGEAEPRFLNGYKSVGDMRWAELECAVKTLGLNGVLYLGYRDSGMPGMESNNHPNALIKAPLEEVTGRMVKTIRELKPQVVITFDPIGGYRHPDHIATHNAAVKAFFAAADKNQFPEAGAPFQPLKLYFGVFRHRWLKFLIKLMPLWGRDPHKFGKNQDIDLTNMVKTEYPVHAAIRLSGKAIELKERATACHASQVGGASPRSGILGFISRITPKRDYYMRAYPKPDRRIESDLFEGIK